MIETTKKEWFLDRYCGQQFAALLENGRLAEFSCENEPRTACVGNIYKGKVVNVLSGMNAAFINCGLSRNCYLSMDETYTDYSKYDGVMAETNHKIHNLKEGDELIVQITKPARGNKGAKVTTHLSFVGKRIIYLPNTPFLGISRKITDEAEREKLLAVATSMCESAEEGFIVRTQAPFATELQLKTETDYLKKLNLTILEKAETAAVGSLLYETEDLPARVIRDCFDGALHAIHVGDEALYQRLLQLIRLRGDIPESKLIKYMGDRSMLQEYGITPLVHETVRPMVPLENGGYLVIEPTEAMTVVDVNTGSFIGSENLEDTVFQMNLVAAKEIARQVRLRNIGGIIVVDFIDMTDESHKAAVTETLKNALALDRAKCNVLPMSELCITQFTRKRLGNNVLSYLVKPCSCCGGIGYVREDIFVVTKIRNALLDCFYNGFTTAVVELNDHIMQKIISEQLFAIEARERWKDKNVYFVPHRTYKEEYFSVRGEHEGDFILPEKAQSLHKMPIPCMR